MALPGEATAEAEGATLGEAKWAAMKQLERRYPGLDVEYVEFDELAISGAFGVQRHHFCGSRADRVK